LPAVNACPNFSVKRCAKRRLKPRWFRISSCCVPDSFATGGGRVHVSAAGVRSLRKIADILREEMDAIGGQELKMPVVHPADLWQETGRWHEIGAEMARLRDRQGRDLALAMTHEEVVADLARRDIRSYKQLPLLVYHIQTKFRDDPRPRAGLVRVREFDMLDSYSLDRNEAGLDEQYRAHYRRISIFTTAARCLPSPSAPTWA